MWIFSVKAEQRFLDEQKNLCADLKNFSPWNLFNKTVMTVLSLLWSLSLLSGMLTRYSGWIIPLTFSLFAEAVCITLFVKFTDFKKR